MEKSIMAVSWLYHEGIMRVARKKRERVVYTSIQVDIMVMFMVMFTVMVVS